MKTNDDIESYLIDLEVDYEQIGEGLWKVHSGAATVVIAHTPPVLVMRVKMFDAPAERREELFTKLLELNTSEMLHGAYGLENGSIVVVDSLQSENLDLNELEASLDSLAMAVHNHHELLSSFHNQQEQSSGK